MDTEKSGIPVLSVLLASGMSEEDNSYRTQVLRGTSHPVAPWGFSWTVGYSVFPNSCVKDCLLSSQMWPCTISVFSPPTLWFPQEGILGMWVRELQRALILSPGWMIQGWGCTTHLPHDLHVALGILKATFSQHAKFLRKSTHLLWCININLILNRNQIWEVHPGRKSAVPLPSVPPYLQVTGAWSAFHLCTALLICTMFSKPVFLSFLLLFFPLCESTGAYDGRSSVRLVNWLQALRLPALLCWAAKSPSPLLTTKPSVCLSPSPPFSSLPISNSAACTADRVGGGGTQATFRCVWAPEAVWL